MCKYCEEQKPIKSINWNGAGEISIGKRGILYGKNDEIFNINYCPMCRKKVERADNIE